MIYKLKLNFRKLASRDILKSNFFYFLKINSSNKHLLQNCNEMYQYLHLSVFGIDINLQ